MSVTCRRCGYQYREAFCPRCGEIDRQVLQARVYDESRGLTASQLAAIDDIESSIDAAELLGQLRPGER